MLAADYRRQFAFRAWPAVLAELPPLTGTRVLDLGCGAGDVAAALAARGARVVGVDGNEALVEDARQRHQGEVDFRLCDLRRLPNVGEFDGIWCSFTAAYFPDLEEPLRQWTEHLRPGGWLAITEVDDLFGHEPLSCATRALFDGYVREALRSARYDFHMGSKLESVLRHNGMHVKRVLSLDDRELAFSGAAEPEVLDAWAARLDRMKLLQAYCGEAFAALSGELLDCLASPTHRSRARVICCLAERPSS